MTTDPVLAFKYSGTKGPTLILETGLGAESAELIYIHEKLGHGVFSYDRAGRGASALTTFPRDAEMMATDLFNLLQTNKIPGPYVVLGHSFGGLVARVFTRKYLTEVIGLILVESMHSQQFERIGPLFPEPAEQEPAILTGMRKFWNQGWKTTESTAEHIDFAKCFVQDTPLPFFENLPVCVITAGSFLHWPFVPEENKNKMQEAWMDMQNSFASISTDLQFEHIAESGHFIQRDCPDVLVQKISEFIDTLPIST